MYCQSVLVTCNHLVPTSIQSMTSTKKADPSSLFSESISTFTKSATKAVCFLSCPLDRLLSSIQFDVFQNQAHGDIARAETDAQQARNQRDEALKALQESTNESQRLKDHVLELKAQVRVWLHYSKVVACTSVTFPDDETELTVKWRLISAPLTITYMVLLSR